MTNYAKHELALIIACLFWGIAPTLSKISLFGFPPLYYETIRFFIGGVVLVLLFAGKFKKISKGLVLNAFLVGALLFSAFTLEIIGLEYITPMKSAFIISFDTVLVPLFFLAFLRKKTRIGELISVLFAFAGLILLNHNGVTFEFNNGVAITLMSAVFYAAFTITLGRVVLKYDASMITVIQLFFVSGLSALLTLFSGETIKSIKIDSMIALIVSGALCAGGAYYLQAYAQEEISPVKAGILYSIIPLFSAIVSWIVLGNTLNEVEFIGGIIIILALININVNLPKYIKVHRKGV